MIKVNMKTYLREPGRYELRPGTAEGAPLCPYGNHYQWIGYDKLTDEYLRFTKSVSKKLMAEQALVIINKPG
jgi:hypothetical protein